MSTRPVRPTAPQERLQAIDALRGFALCGILIGNMQWFAGYGLMPTVLIRLNATVDQVTHFLVYFFVEGKFYSIFSFLFGFGFALQIQRAEQRGDSEASLFKWRLLWLLLIGMLHMTLLWAGDILNVYALTGFLLLLFRRKTDRSILHWAFALTLIPILTYTLVYILTAFLAPPAATAVASPDIARATNFWNARINHFSQGSYLQILKENIRLVGERFIYLLYEMRVPKVLAMFLLGMFAFRRGYFQDFAAHRAFIRRVMWWGLVIGLPGNAVLATLMWMHVFVPPSPLGIVETVTYAFAVPALALFYIAAFVTLWQDWTWQRVLIRLAPAGRMALTNYLLQTLICVFIFRGFGLGLFGRVGVTAATVAAIFIFILQALSSAWWLRDFSYGPVEWVWRQLTYRQRLPLRLRQRQFEIGSPP